MAHGRHLFGVFGGLGCRNDDILGLVVQKRPLRQAQLPDLARRDRDFEVSSCLGLAFQGPRGISDPDPNDVVAHGASYHSHE